MKNCCYGISETDMKCLLSQIGKEFITRPKGLGCEETLKLFKCFEYLESKMLILKF